MFEQKYILLLSSRLEKFKRKSHNLWNCRCPLCGDSQTNPNKARGYIFEKKGIFFFHCHNCNVTKPFDKFLKELDPVLYQDYVQEKFLSPKSTILEDETFIPKNVKIREQKLWELETVSQLKYNHYAKQYIVSRKIPNKFHCDLYYAPRFMSWTNTILPKKFSEKALKHDGPRIVIPFRDRQSGDVFGFQGRALDPKDGIRYISIVLDETKPRAYGLNRINFSKKYYVFEGPFDSMFIENAFAICGSDIVTTLMSLDVSKERGVVVFDNEPRNKDIVKNVGRAIRLGYSVVIWPGNLAYKDINDMIVKGNMSASEVHHLIDEYTFSGLEAELRLAGWKKV